MTDYTDSRLPGWRFFRGESGRWVGVNDDLKLSAEGDTRSEAQEAAAEASDLLWDDIIADATKAEAERTGDGR